MFSVLAFHKGTDTFLRTYRPAGVSRRNPMRVEIVNMSDSSGRRNYEIKADPFKLIEFFRRAIKSIDLLDVEELMAR